MFWGAEIKFFLNKDEETVRCLNKESGTIIPFNSIHPRLKNSKLYKFTGCLKCGYEYICRNLLKNRDIDYRTFEINIDWIFQSNGASLSTYLAPPDSRI